MKTMHRLYLLTLAFVVAFAISASAESSFTEADFVKSMLELTFSAIDCDYEINGNSAGYIVRYSNEDISFSYLMSMLFGDTETDKMMAEATASVVDLCSATRANIEMLGVKNPNITLILTDYSEKDYIFLIVYNGQIIYDILAD